MTPDKDYDNRLSRVEAVVEGLADELGKLTKAVQTISDRTRPQWGNYMAAASVLLLIIGMVGSVVVNCFRTPLLSIFSVIHRCFVTQR